MHLVLKIHVVDTDLNFCEIFLSLWLLLHARAEKCADSCFVLTEKPKKVPLSREKLSKINLSKKVIIKKIFPLNNKTSNFHFQFQCNKKSKHFIWLLMQLLREFHSDFFIKLISPCNYIISHLAE